MKSIKNSPEQIKAAREELGFSSDFSDMENFPASIAIIMVPPSYQFEPVFVGRFKRLFQRFTLLLKHRPGPSPLYSGVVDLQLSGHTHQGQIFPFGLLTRMIFPYPGGLSSDRSGWLYVSRGTGTWGPPIRVLSPPEVTIIDLVPVRIEEGEIKGKLGLAELE